MRFFCQTCAYIQNIDVPITKKLPLARKKVDDVLGGEEAWANVDQTDASCPAIGCANKRAYFMQIQIRSADEPMTTFYKCTKCQKTWNSN
jgi:DNA-directed RNA polymerase III subunit RPC11